ncbi:redox-sensing transcriptional repressor Rex [Desulfitobacterium sp.]|uniref:redox-sensing transcriptional repressor Rex n=1 Tax=Desulfitobacterium sp. TaxID=49981 RepID=UPI002C9E57DC|nr:redox-sensing transcriptional repressor Rex [Desulfitobacterium sp.]HVJ50303.1 redox-sensing transcriptional repressor Rex [Desulfitobacterium sp.]
MRVFKIPEATIMRLSVYSRFLTKVKKQGKVTISSNDIAKGAGVNSAQVRKDLSFFGEFGTRGVGYNVEELEWDILKILGLTVEWNAALVGFGHLGHALALHRGFQERGFNFTCIFDNDPLKIGTKLNDVEVLPLAKLEEVVAQNHTRIGVISVPADAAQDIADSLVRAGVQAILNFAPVYLSVPQDIELRNVDLAVNLEVLTFYLEMHRQGYSTERTPNLAK